MRMLLRETEAAEEILAGLGHDREVWHPVAYFYGVQEISNRLTERADLPKRIGEMLTPALKTFGITHPNRFL
ncbi:hypothetical protein E3O62_04280 [Cryobacterium sp. TMT2-15-1]|uniref:hypothetical protein n=1 Tax=Cryobacterium sp. TMT2-15-1 TaxID=1259246 RepID=UPI00106DB5B9|nr:hypothetical protein [Cryobacterium sp. TMT2-15-1]TFC62262.1 hypothetical protein E3O62_04280 [Cryobacterium sp. TMT2-15-1]